MLRVLPDGENRHRLLDEHGKEVGWIRGRAVRFFGFAETQVVDAARRAWRAVEDVLRRQLPPGPEVRPLRRLGFVHDGAYEWISDGTVPVARLFRPNADAGGDSSFAIELVVPSYASDVVAIAAARAIAEAVRPVLRDSPPFLDQR